MGKLEVMKIRSWEDGKRGIRVIIRVNPCQYPRKSEYSALAE